MPIVAESTTTTPTPTLATLARVKLTGTAAPVITGQPDTAALRFVFTDNGTDWEPVRGYERVLCGPGQSVVAYDYEAPPNEARQYAVQSIRVLNGADIISKRSADGVTAGSSLSVTMTLDSSWLKDVEEPTDNMRIQMFRGRGDTFGESLSEEQREDRRAISEKYLTTYSEVIQGEEFERTLTFYGKAELNAFEKLRHKRKTLLLQDMSESGEEAQYYVRLGKTRRRQRLVTDQVIYRVTIDFSERPRP